MNIKELLEGFNHHFTLWIVFPSIICLGLYLSFRLRLMQILQLKKSLFYLTKKNNSAGEGNISRFEAIATVLAGNFGTGNISGMAVAVATGGPGALIWMWAMALFGAIIQYASCVLGGLFRRKTKEGEYVGGPMYYLYDGLAYKGLAVLFALLTICGSITVGNWAQTNSVILPLQKMGIDPIYCSIGIAFFVAIVILGGIQRIASFASYIVPLKALLYLGTAWVIIVLHYDQVAEAFGLMFRSAFDFSSFIGGSLGAGVLKAMTTGFDRGLFATDAGTGIVPILQASVRSKNPVIDGIATLISPFMVMVVCTTTGLVLILTGVWQDTELQSTNMVTHAFSQGLNSSIGGYIVITALILFAYTTILAWAYCGEKAFEFITGQTKKHWFRYLFIGITPLGGLLKVDMIWILADIAITLMLITNLIGILRLSGLVISSSRQFQNSTINASLESLG